MFGGRIDAGATVSAIAALWTIGDAAKDASKVRREIGDMAFFPMATLSPGERAQRLD
jgi:hypothetical protein